jgi:hypothetical protein
MSRPVSSALKTASKPALKNQLLASTMPLLAPPTVSEEPESPGHGRCRTGTGGHGAATAADADQRVQRLAADAD